MTNITFECYQSFNIVKRFYTFFFNYQMAIISVESMDSLNSICFDLQNRKNCLFQSKSREKNIGECVCIHKMHNEIENRIQNKDRMLYYCLILEWRARALTIFFRLAAAVVSVSLSPFFFDKITKCTFAFFYMKATPYEQ